MTKKRKDAENDKKHTPKITKEKYPENKKGRNKSSLLEPYGRITLCRNKRSDTFV